MTCTFTPRAESDFEAIGDYIAQDSPSRARSYVRELRAFCRQMAETPQMKPEIGTVDGFVVRIRHFGSYRIYYSWGGGDAVVWIVHLRHTSREALEV